MKLNNKKRKQTFQQSSLYRKKNQLITFIFTNILHDNIQIFIRNILYNYIFYPISKQATISPNDYIKADTAQCIRVQAIIPKKTT